MSDTIAVMKDGMIVQEGPPSAIYAEPAAAFIADFIGKTNLLKAKVIAGEGNAPDGRAVLVETPIGKLVCRTCRAQAPGKASPSRSARKMWKCAAGDNGPSHNSVSGEVDTVVYLGNLLDCIVCVGGERIRVQLHPSQALVRGDPVTLHFPTEHCLVLPR